LCHILFRLLFIIRVVLCVGKIACSVLSHFLWLLISLLFHRCIEDLFVHLMYGILRRAGERRHINLLRMLTYIFHLFFLCWFCFIANGWNLLNLLFSLFPNFQLVSCATIFAVNIQVSSRLCGVLSYQTCCCFI